MTRSRKKRPIRGITSAGSEKADKQAAHRKERRQVRQACVGGAGPEVLPQTREISNVWAMAKDGKVYLGAKASPRDLWK